MAGLDLKLGTERREEPAADSSGRRWLSRVRRRPAVHGMGRGVPSDLDYSAVALTILRADLL